MMKRSILFCLLCLTSRVLFADQMPQFSFQKQEVKKESKFARIKTFIYENKGSIAVALVAGGTVYMIIRKLNALEKSLSETCSVVKSTATGNRTAIINDINDLRAQLNNGIRAVRNDIGRLENSGNNAGASGSAVVAGDVMVSARPS